MSGWVRNGILVNIFLLVQDANIGGFQSVLPSLRFLRAPRMPPSDDGIKPRLLKCDRSLRFGVLVAAAQSRMRPIDGTGFGADHNFAASHNLSVFLMAGFG